MFNLPGGVRRAPGSAALWPAFGLLDNLFENVLNGQAGPQETYSIAVHQLKQIAAGPVDTGDALQVNRDPPAGLARASGLPAVFQLRHKGPGQSPFDL